MQRIFVFALVGFIAQLVDGSLGMAYGVTSSTLLLSYGIAPAVASASIHIAEVGTTLASGVSHWKLGNVDWRSVIWMAIPGGAGAFLGAVVLTSIPVGIAVPWIALFLMGLGFYVMFRFLHPRVTFAKRSRAVRRRVLSPLGFVAGFLDASGGGGWGPIATPTLLASGRLQPRHVIGTVDTSEFVVALCASIGFLVSLNMSTISPSIVAPFLISGLIAAPVAAILVKRLNPRILGTAAGGMIVLTNARTLLSVLHVEFSAQVLVYSVLITLWLSAMAFVVTLIRRERGMASVSASGD